MFKYSTIFIILTFINFSFSMEKYNSPLPATPKLGLMIIDAQKWYIPEHEEPMYQL